jgi:hypothetical protein
MERPYKQYLGDLMRDKSGTIFMPCEWDYKTDKFWVMIIKPCKPSAMLKGDYMEFEGERVDNSTILYFNESL